MSLTNCRYYEEKYPEVDSFVMVNVKQVRFLPVLNCVLGLCDSPIFTRLQRWVPT
jgi:hypothetical protein